MFFRTWCAAKVADSISDLRIAPERRNRKTNHLLKPTAQSRTLLLPVLVMCRVFDCWVWAKRWQPAIPEGGDEQRNN